MATIKGKVEKKQKIANVGKDVEKMEPLCTVGEVVKWCSHCGKTAWQLFKKLKTELPYNPAILLLGIYSKELNLRDVCTHLFVAAFFLIAKR